MSDINRMNLASLETPLMREKCMAWRLAYFQSLSPVTIEFYEKNKGCEVLTLEE